MKAWMIAALLLSCNAYAQDSSAPLQLETSFPQVKLETTMGTIVVELDANKAPITVNNFLTYVSKGHYDNTIFHRVIDGFVVQGGGVTPDFKEKPTLTAIANESGNGLSNQPGTIAMARSMDPHSATSQFFFNVADNSRLDPSPKRWGYAVFGEVVSGMEVIDAIAKVETGQQRTLNWQDVPLQPVLLKKATLLSDK